MERPVVDGSKVECEGSSQTWKKLIMVGNTKKQGEMVTHITTLGIYQNIPATTAMILHFTKKFKLSAFSDQRTACISTPIGRKR